MIYLRHRFNEKAGGDIRGDIETNSTGHGIGDCTGIFSQETFILSDPAIAMAHLGIWFPHSNDAGAAGCSNLTTRFDGDHGGGILGLSTSNFADDNGPPLQRKEAAIATRSRHESVRAERAQESASRGRDGSSPRVSAGYERTRSGREVEIAAPDSRVPPESPWVGSGAHIFSFMARRTG